MKNVSRKTVGSVNSVIRSQNFDEVTLIPQLDSDITLDILPTHDYAYKEYSSENKRGSPMGFIVARVHVNKFEHLPSGQTLMLRAKYR
jgi:hypothetical protein